MSYKGDDVADCIAAGMSQAEAEAFVAVGDAASKLLRLPEQHSADNAEVAQAIHVLQNYLMQRPVYRKLVELWKDQGWEPKPR